MRILLREFCIHNLLSALSTMLLIFFFSPLTPCPAALITDGEPNLICTTSFYSVSSSGCPHACVDTNSFLGRTDCDNRHSLVQRWGG